MYIDYILLILWTCYSTVYVVCLATQYFLVCIYFYVGKARLFYYLHQGCLFNRDLIKVFLVKLLLGLPLVGQVLIEFRLYSQEVLAGQLTFCIPNAEVLYSINCPSTMQ